MEGRSQALQTPQVPCSLQYEGTASFFPWEGRWCLTPTPCLECCWRSTSPHTLSRPCLPKS